MEAENEIKTLTVRNKELSGLVECGEKKVKNLSEELAECKKREQVNKFKKNFSLFSISLYICNSFGYLNT